MKKGFLRTIALFCSVAMISALAFMLNLGGTEAAHTIPQDGLVAYWNLDEGTGTVAADLADKIAGRDLKAFGNAQWVTGKYGKAFYFDGTTVLAMNGDKCVRSENVSVSLWAKVDQWPVSKDSNGADLFMNVFMVNSDLGALAKGAFDFGFSLDKVYSYVTGVQWDAGDRVMDEIGRKEALTGSWHNYTVVWNTAEGAEYAKIYIDGVEVAHKNLTAIVGLPIMLGYYKLSDYHKCDLNIGGYAHDSAAGDNKNIDRGIIGAMDDIAIYDRALTVAEVRELAGLPAVVESSSVSSSSSSSSSTSSTAVSSATDSSIASESGTVSDEVSSETESVDSQSSINESSTAQSISSSAASTSEPISENGGNNTLVTILIIAGAVIAACVVGYFIVFGKK